MLDGCILMQKPCTRDNDKMSAVVLLVNDVELNRLKKGEVIQQLQGFDTISYKDFVSTKSKREGV